MDDPYRLARTSLVRDAIEERGIHDPGLLEAMRQVRRHLFVPSEIWSKAYENRPLEIGHDQTISQPYIVALMSEALALPFDGDGAKEVGSVRTTARGRPKVLEIGTGSGYQAAILDRLGAEVYSIEIIEPLARRAEDLLARLGHAHVHVRVGDGFRGWPEEAPFDGIIVTAAPAEIPRPLEEQLAEGAHLVGPVGCYPRQWLVRLTRRRGPSGDWSREEENLGAVLFVPMTGEVEKGSSRRSS